MKKLRFSFSKPCLENNLSALRSLNDDFRTLSSQLLSSRTPHSHNRVDSRPRQSRQEVERYQVIRQASQQVYEALGKACTKHTEHQARFCVEVEQPIIHDNLAAQVKFNLAYTHTQLADNADQNDFIWFVVDSTSGNVSRHGPPVDITCPQDSFTSSLKRQIEPTTNTVPKKVKKSVRFESPTLKPTYTTLSWPSPTIASAILSHEIMRRDLCDF